MGACCGSARLQQEVERLQLENDALRAANATNQSAVERLKALKRELAEQNALVDQLEKRLRSYEAGHDSPVPAEA